MRCGAKTDEDDTYNFTVCADLFTSQSNKQTLSLSTSGKCNLQTGMTKYRKGLNCSAHCTGVTGLQKSKNTKDF